MEKFILNNEIVLCRSLVRKAKVKVIRKKIKQIKLLKANKKQDPKKLNKAERFLQEVMSLKKVREDDVTKYALQQKEPNHKSSDKILATLANQKELQDVISQIKSKIDQDKIIELLKTLGTRSMLKKYKLKNKGITPSMIKAKKIEMQADNATFSASKQECNSPPESENDNSNIDSDISLSKESSEEEVSDAKHSSDNTIIKSQCNIKPKTDVSPVKEIKVDDPFFVGKKVIVPKLLMSENTTKAEKKHVDCSSGLYNKARRNENRPRIEKQKGVFKKETTAKSANNRSTAKFGETTRIAHIQIENEKLHPSWAAKRQALTIKPFQGKKIRFDDE